MEAIRWKGSLCPCAIPGGCVGTLGRGENQGSQKEPVARALLFLGSAFSVFLLCEAMAVFLDASPVSSASSLGWKDACVCFPFGV